MENITSINVLDDSEAVAATAQQLLLDAAQQAIADRGRFVLCLAGGSTPKLLYRKLARLDIDYSNWFLVYGDERCLPVDDPERNSRLVLDEWLLPARFPLTQHLEMPAELGAIDGAEQYKLMIRDLLPIDFCLLGMGEDGHTASLFPGHEHDESAVVAVFDSPKPPADRVSLNFSVLNQCRNVCFLVTGQGKQAAMAQWQAGIKLPVAGVEGVDQTVLLVDKAACPEGLLKNS